MPFRFDHPQMLWLLLLAGPILWLGWRSLSTLDRARRWTAATLRLLVLLLLVLILAGMQTVRWHEGLTVVAVLDQSESVRRFALPPVQNESSNEPATMRQWISDLLGQSMRERHKDDRLGLVAFDGQPLVHSMPSESPNLDASASDVLEGTDISSAIRLGMAVFPSDSSKRLLLITDGNDTHAGSSEGVLAAAREARAAGIPIDVMPVEYQLKNEVMVDAIYAPAQSRSRQTISLRVVLSAMQPTEGMLYVKHDGVAVDLSPDTPGPAAMVRAGDWQKQPGPEGDRYVFVPRIEVPTNSAGANQFEAIFEPNVAADQVSANNHAQTFTMVHGKGRVLFVNNVTHASGTIIADALIKRGIELDLIEPHALVMDLATLSRYDAVILNNVPAEMVPPPQQKNLAIYVNDLGGGLIMIGGPDSFGAGGWTNTPIDRILPVACEIPNQSIMPSGALVFVIDRSGSMSAPVAGSQYSQQEVANEAAVLAISALFPQDLVGVVAFDSSATWIVKITPNADPVGITRKVRSIQPGGGTDIYPGLNAAYRALSGISPEQAAVRHIILLSDGQSNPGGYDQVIASMVQEGITLSTVGVGDGVDAQLLTMLANATGGQFYQVSNPLQLPQIFVKEARTIRRTLIKELAFQPQMRATGSTILSGVTGVPALHGFVLTGPKHDPRVFTPLIGPEGEPIFAHWQVGLGRSAAFTSDATSRWANDWLNWSGFADFWTRTVRAIARTSVQGGYDLVTSVENERLRIRLDATTSLTDEQIKSGFVNFLDVVGSVLLPDGTMQSVTLRQVGPGLYETDMPAKSPGNYIVNVFARDPQSDKPMAVFGGVTRPVGPELRRFRSDRALLEQIAQITGGRVLEPGQVQPATLFERDASIVPTRSIRPIWRTLMILLFVAFLLDVAVRRIAWDFDSIRRSWSRTVGSVFHTRQVESRATLDALKRRSAEVGQRLAGPDGKVSQAPAVAAAAGASNTKFEADADEPVPDDFMQSLAGAKATAVADRVKAESSTDVEEQPQTTSRLLDAKRRARQRMDENES